MGQFYDIEDKSVDDPFTEQMWDQQLKANIELLINPPQARVYRATDQNVPNTTETVLSFSNARWDSDGCFDATDNPTRLTCQTEGLYSIEALVQFTTSPNNAGIRRAQLRVNGTTVIAQDQYPALTPSGQSIFLNPAAQWYMNVGDYVEVVVYQGSGAALAVSSVDALSPELMMVRA